MTKQKWPVNHILTTVISKLTALEQDYGIDRHRINQLIRRIEAAREQHQETVESLRELSQFYITENPHIVDYGKAQAILSVEEMEPAE